MMIPTVVERRGWRRVFASLSQGCQTSLVKKSQTMSKKSQTGKKKQIVK